MKFIDIDGVLGDFFGWALEKIPTTNDCIESAVKFYKEAFLDSKVLEENLYLLSGEYRLLSSLPSIKHILKYTTVDNVDEILYTFKENKLKFTDKLGVNRSNVIILNSSVEKTLYAKGNILYDDWYKNIQNWELAGGTGFLVKS